MRDSFITRTICSYLMTVTVCDMEKMTMYDDTRITIDEPTEKNFRTLYSSIVKDTKTIIPVALKTVETVEHLYRMPINEFIVRAEMVK